MELFFIAIISLIALVFFIKKSADSFAIEFWKDVEAEVVTRCDVADLDGRLAVVTEQLMNAETGKLPIIIKHAPSPEYRALANYAYNAKRFFQK